MFNDWRDLQIYAVSLVLEVIWYYYKLFRIDIPCSWLFVTLPIDSRNEVTTLWLPPAWPASCIFCPSEYQTKQRNMCSFGTCGYTDCYSFIDVWLASAWVECGVPFQLYSLGYQTLYHIHMRKGLLLRHLWTWVCLYLLQLIRDEHILTVANLASIYGSYLWPSDDAPRYTVGLSVTSAFCFACALSALAMKYLDRKYPYSFDFAKWGTEDENEEVIIIEKEPAWNSMYDLRI